MKNSITIHAALAFKQPVAFGQLYYFRHSPSDKSLIVEKLTGLLNISGPMPYRKTKLLSALSPDKIINAIRLKKTAKLPVKDNYKKYRTASTVRCALQTNFRKNLPKQFGMIPSGYLAMRDRLKSKPDTDK